MKNIITIAILCLMALGAFAQSTNTYEYDNLNRLTKVTYANGAVVQYSYDAVGNRLTKTVAGAYVSYTVTATADPTTGGSVTGGGTFQHGQSCTLTATANSGYTFVNWTKNGTQVSTNATYTFTVTESATFVANFTASPVNYTITVSANPSAGGTVSGGGSFIQGQNCTLTATANSGYTFTNWTENGNVVSTNATYSFVVTGDRTLVANFEQNASYPSLLSDDFNDGVIDPELWTYTGNAVLEEEGLLKLQQNITDQDVHLRSIDLNVPADGKVNMVRKFMVHRASNYFNGRHTIQLNGDLNSFIQLEYVYTLYYDNAYQSVPKTGVYLITKLDGVESEIRLCDINFDTWLIESVEVDFTAGTLSYNMNSSVNTVTIPGLAEQTVNHYNVEYGPWGWWTGHYHHMDYVNINVNQGNLTGLFSVSDNTQVNFSQGNLQYQASTNTWRFAENQWDYVGVGNANISSTYDGWIDLFGWGTSGYNHGANSYQPWSTSTNNSDYYAYGSDTCNLYDQTGQADWGYNAISNGGNTTNEWRTLTRPEWAYIIYNRSTTSGIRFAKAQVTGVNGVVLLPDDWDVSYYELNSTNSDGASFSSNIITAQQWSTLEQHGAVFLPAAGGRSGTSVYNAGSYGYYWSAMYYDSDHARLVFFRVDDLKTGNWSSRYYGLSVRLVCPAENCSYSINATSNPAEGGTIYGAGFYEEGSTCTLTATPNTGYTFVRWTKNGNQVSTSPSYSFTVTGNATYVAEFEQSAVTHTKALDTGWNWWSTYIEMDGTDGLTQLENSLGSIGMMIKSRNDGYVEPYNYNGSTGWFGTLSSLSNEQMYKIEVSEDGGAAVTGTVTGTSSHPITINNGWNWIGYPLNQSVGVETALSSFSPVVDDILKGLSDYSFYYDDGVESGWFGTLNTLEPGCGYMYHSQSSGTKTLVFQTGRGEATVANITPENNINKPMGRRFADNMVVTAVVEANGEELRSDAYELAAFADGECRGSVKLLYVEPFDRYVAFLTVFGEAGDELEFRLTDGMETQLSSDVLAYTIDGVEGTLTSPKVLHFGPLGMDETLAMVRIYPNPVRRKGALNIAFPEASGVLTVEIANVLGVTVYKSKVVVGPSSEAHLTLPDVLVPATYVLKAIRHDGTVYYGKLVVE